MLKRIALATSKDHANLTEDDRKLVPALRRVGIDGQPAVWDDRSVRWPGFEAVVIRSCWDYHKRLDDFLEWLAKVERLAVPVFNLPDIIRWNCDKRYLKKLAEKGVVTAPSVWLEASDPHDLDQILSELPWEEVVVKPTVSATAFRTWRVATKLLRSDHTRIRAMLAEIGPVIVQPFMTEIATEGEWSLIFFDKQFSHAVFKRPQPGDFRVQEEYGGQAIIRQPPQSIVEEAKQILQTLDADLLYARVDGLSKNGQFVLMELELIEPALYLGFHSEAPDRFAQALSSRLETTN